MVRLAPVAAPVTQEVTFDHVECVSARNAARQLIDFQNRQPSTFAFGVELLQQSSTRQRNIILAEPSALHWSLTAGDCPEPERKRRRRLKEGTTIDHVPLRAQHFFGPRTLINCHSSYR